MDILEIKQKDDIEEIVTMSSYEDDLLETTVRTWLGRTYSSRNDPE